MSNQKNRIKKVSFKNSVGVLTVVLVAAYFIFMFVSFSKQEKISFFEVEEGSIVKESSYQGLILRSETVKTSEASGYVNFYIQDAKKVSMNSRVYSIDESGDLKNFIQQHSEEIEQFSTEKMRSLHSDMMLEARNFDPQDFKKSYLFKEKLEADVIGLSGNDVLSRLSDELRSAGIKYIDCRTDQTGIVSYCIDGFEEKKRNDLKTEDFDRSVYSSTRLKSNDLITSGTPVYKLITNENWEIVFPLTEEDIAQLSDQNTLKINFRNHGLETTADFEIFKTPEGKSFGALRLKRYLIRFLNDRFVDFEIETNNVSGLKIPEKSVTTKEFYRIPKSLKKKDARGNYGVYRIGVSNGSDSFTFVVAEFYMEDEEYAYINLPADGDLKPGDCIGDPEDPDVSCRLGDVKSLQGAYNINKGYAVFKQIEELERANGYCIIKKNTPYGLSIYDHIILDASTVEEGEILY